MTAARNVSTRAVNGLYLAQGTWSIADNGSVKI
jgi:hypothetical protein